jgi:hypothetical protein
MGISMIKQVRLIFKLSVILLLFTLRADAGMLMMGGGTTSGGAPGTWYYSDANRTETTSDDISAYVLAAPITISTGTSVTKIAAKIATKGSSTEVKLGLFTNVFPNSLLAEGVCTPVDTTWCVATISYTATANATYKVAAQSNNTGTTLYGYGLGHTGAFTSPGTYSGAMANAAGTWTDAYDTTWIFAICAGGTCSSGPS